MTAAKLCHQKVSVDAQKWMAVISYRRRKVRMRKAQNLVRARGRYRIQILWEKMLMGANWEEAL